MSHKMSNRRYGFLPLVVFLLSASSTLASVMSTLDELEEIDGALKHTQVSLDDLSSLVFEVFTTDSSSSQTAKEDLVWVNSEVIDNIIDSIVYKARVRIKKENNVRIPREKIISNMHYRIELAEYLDSSQWMADMEEEGKKEVEEEEKDKDLSYEDGKETNTPTSTLGPWRDRVYSVLDDILEVTTAISNGDTHHEQAYRLDQLATLLDTLVEEGLNDTSVLQEINQDDVEYINSIKTKTDDTRKIIKKEIEKAKKEKRELIVAITMLSILFVVVVVAVVFFMVRPWAGSCKYPRSKSKSRLRDSIIPSGDSREFANSSFQDRSHQMRLQERISTRDTAA